MQEFRAERSFKDGQLQNALQPSLNERGMLLALGLTSTRMLRLVAAALLIALAAGWWIGRSSDPGWPPSALKAGNLLLVTIDTMRADRLSAALTPNLTRLAGTGHLYRAAYAHAPLTLPSHASILTGLLPPAHGVRGNGAFRLDPAHLTLAERLGPQGYRTGAFVGAFVLDSRFGLAQGFDRYDGVDDDRAFAADFGFAERRAPDVLAAASQWILDAAAPERPWFAWVHLFDPHAPYDAPGSSSASYDDEVRFVDRALGDFFLRLDRAGAMTRTLVMITADHGESLGEHGESTHGLFAYDATTRVPLVVAGPGLGTGTHDAPAALIDLVPTALDVLGLPEDSTLPGRSLRVVSAGGTGRAVYLEAMDGWLTAGAAPITAVVQDSWKWIDAPIPELYDLATDPEEIRNAIDAAGDRARALQAALRPLTTTSATTAAMPRDAGAEARLRSLGYASGGPRAAPNRFSDADDPKRVAPLYERFLSILAEGGRDLAGLQAIVDARPSFEAARLAAASVLIESGRGADAARLLEAAAAAPGASLALRERLGAAYLAAGRSDRAVTVLEAAVEDPSASADAWNALGVARAQLGRPSEARAAFDKAAALAPAAARIVFNRVLARLESGDRAGAEAEISELNARHPNFVDGWKLVATLRHESGDIAAAVEAWQRVLVADPRDVDVMFNLAVTLRDLGRTNEARAMARRFVDAAPRPAYDREAATLAPLIAPR